MNFLGHAYLARNNPELIAGNFAGDGYKGNLDNFDFLPSNILNGVRLHRKIDDITDTNSDIKSAGKIFQENGVSKVAFIATDILLDYYLSSRWGSYHKSDYEVFLQFIYQNTDKHLNHLEANFTMMYNRLKKDKWMHHYNTLEGIDQIMWQFSRRIGFKNDLLLAFQVYKKDPDEINEYFHRFLIDIDLEVSDYIQYNLK